MKHGKKHLGPWMRLAAGRPVRQVLSIVMVLGMLWSGGAQAQVTFRETFGSVNANMPTAQSTAQGNWLSTGCQNNRIIGTVPDSVSDGAASTHYLFHGTAVCAYSGGLAVWRTVSAIPVEPNKTYMFSFWTMVANSSGNPALSQTAVPNTGTITLISTAPTNNYPGINNAWVRRAIIFSTSATTTAVTLNIFNGNTGATGNDFGLDDIMLVPMPTVTLTKTTTGQGGGPFNFALTNTATAAGSVTTAAANVPLQVDGNPVAGLQPFTATTVGNPITITEGAAAGWMLTGGTCDIAGTPVGSFDLATRTYSVPGANVVAGEDIACNFTNRATANLNITKTDSVGAVNANGSTTYSLVVTNNGPLSADGSTVQDDWSSTPSGGLNCLGPATCVASGTVGTQCPAGVTPAQLQSGVPIPQFPSGGVVTFTLQCAVSASGL